MIRKPKKKLTKKKVLKAKFISKVKQTKKNPITSRKTDNTYYITLSDFVKELNKQLKKNTSYDFYYDLGYEIDNILKYSLRNTNLVSGGEFNLISLREFKRILSKGVEHRFVESGYYVDIITGFELTMLEIPKDVTYVDTGN